MADYEVGYGKPPVETRFGAGNKANPIGKTSEHRKAEIEAAELAAKSRLAAVAAFARLMDGSASDEDRIALVDANALKLLKDSEDRAFGTASQHVDQTSSDGSARLPQRIILVGPEDADSA